MTALSLQDINLSIDITEPRIQDLRLAEALGFSQLRDIRKIISRNIETLKSFGEVVCATVAQTSKGGRPTESYYLNEKQALYLCTKSEAQNAIDITIEMVEVFHGVKTGQYNKVETVETVDKGALAIIRESRLLFGKEAARLLWMKLGLPALPALPALPGEKGAPAWSDNQLREFIEDACLVTGHADDIIMPRMLYLAFCDWCEKERRIPLNQIAFFRQFARQAGKIYQGEDGENATFAKRKSSTTYYAGLRLREGYSSMAD